MPLSSPVYPKILCSNVRSVLPKIDEVRSTVLTKNVDIFVCTETWLNEKHTDDLISIDGFNCFRDDRNDRIGGGVAVWVKRSFLSMRLQSLHPPGFECVALHLSESKLLLLSAYIPPIPAVSRAKEINDFFIDFIDDFLVRFPIYEVVICGDLNRFDISMVCNNFDLKNVYDKPTYGNAQLDYFLLSGSLVDVFCVTDCPPFDRSVIPHLSLVANPVLPVASQRDTVLYRNVFDLRTSNVDHFVSVICQTNFEFIYSDQLTLDEKCTAFNNVMKHAFRQSIPCSVVTCTPKDKPWITPLVKDLINKRWRAYRRRDFHLFKHMKEKVKKEIEKSKLIWSKRIKATNLWRAVHVNMGTKSSNPIQKLLMEYDIIQCGIEAISSALGKVFAKSDNNSDYKVSDYYTPNMCNWIVDVSPWLVLDTIRKIPTSKRSSDLPTILYKKAAIFLAEPLSHLFKLSIEGAEVPKCWKIAAVSPIPKKSSPTVDDIRPISLLPFPSKILELLVAASLKSKFVAHFGEFQYGYRPRSSTLCALAALHESMTAYLDDKNVEGIVIVSYDYSKAFDKLSHELIIKRLFECQFPLQFISWLKHYFEGRQHYVRYGLTESRIVNVPSGVPQGSVIGPLLFALTVGSFCPQRTDGCCLIRYADDTGYCFPIFKSCSNEYILQEHEHLIKWSDSMNLTMNKSKCKSLIIKKSENCEEIRLPGVTSVESLTILGVCFNNKCTWSSNVDRLVKLSSRRFYALRLLRPSLDKSQFRIVYDSLVLSVLNYCAPLFVGLGSCDSDRLEKLQKRFHRLLCGKHCKLNCLTSLKQRRETMALRFLQTVSSEYHILNKYLPYKSSTGRYILPTRDTNRRSNSFFLFTAELYNNLFTR
jgi:hypothetical protein